MNAIGAPGSIARAASERDWQPGEFGVYAYKTNPLRAVIITTGTREFCESQIKPGRFLIDGDNYRTGQE